MLTKFKITATKKFEPFADMKNGTFVWSQEVAAFLRGKAEEALTCEFPGLTAMEYIRFFEDGNRHHYEKNRCFPKREAVLMLLLGELIERKGRYINKIIDGVWSICEESTWVIPAHQNHYHFTADTRNILPDCEELVTFVDLFSSETASGLSWVYYFLKEQLDAVSPLICKRIRHEIEQRVLTPYLTCDDFQWMGLGTHRDEPVNNWNPWINSNVLTALLLVETDALKQREGIEKVMQSLSSFVNKYGEDGGCNEGPSYWGAAGAALFDCLELLYTLTDGAISVYENETIKNIGRYIQHVHVADDYFLNFADGAAKFLPCSHLIYQYGKRIQDENLAAFGAALNQTFEPRPLQTFLWAQYRLLCYLSGYEAIKAAKAEPQVLQSKWFPNLEVAVLRQSAQEKDGFCLAAKGGHNNESHNHNDIGSFVLYAQGQPLCIDVGVETYTAKTFSPQRYEIWTMQSAYHNTLTLNGVQQTPGAASKATEMRYEPGEETERLSLQLQAAYPAQAGIEICERDILFDRKSRTVKIEDVCHFTRDDNEVALTIMCPCEPRVLAAQHAVELTTPQGTRALLRYAPTLSPQAECIALTDPKLQKEWGETLYRLQLTAANLPQHCNFRIEFQELPNA